MILLLVPQMRKSYGTAHFFLFFNVIALVYCSFRNFKFCHLQTFYFIGPDLLLKLDLCFIAILQVVRSYVVQVVKIADFGVARVLVHSGVMTAETGTYRWMAPEVCYLYPSVVLEIIVYYFLLVLVFYVYWEVIEHKPYNHKADVFSFGVMLWELLTGKVVIGHDMSITLISYIKAEQLKTINRNIITSFRFSNSRFHMQT